MREDDMRRGHSPDEPMHQPPNPAELEQYPPSGPECARVRGLMRDFVDGDLGPALAGSVEEHVHECRSCALALARAEHEPLVIRRGLAEIAASRGEGKREQAGPCATFRDEVMAALISSSSGPEEAENLGMSGPGNSEAGNSEEGASPARTIAPTRRSTSLTGGFVLIAALVTVLVVVHDWMGGRDLQAPEPVARMVVVESENGQRVSGSRPLSLYPGALLGDEDLLMVGDGGNVLLELHDATQRTQPAARMWMNASAAMGLENGSPVLIRGEVKIETQRDVTLVTEDGSRFEFGIGSYRLTAERLGVGAIWDPLAGAASELRIGVEVLSGDGANIVRDGRQPFFVSAGKIGRYSGSAGTVAVTQGSGSAYGGGYARGAARANPGTNPLGSLHGIVWEANGTPALGADVLVQIVNGRQSYRRGSKVESDGYFRLEVGGVGLPPLFDAPYAIVQVFPPGHKGGLGVTVPDARRLILNGNHARLVEPVICEGSPALTGEVLNEAEEPVFGARMVPCVVDELLGTVLPWAHALCSTGASGRYRMTRLPVDLPWHQALVLVVFHPLYETAIVPVPARGSRAATSFRGRVTMRGLRTVGLVGLPPNSQLKLWQDVSGLPEGTGARGHTVGTDGHGKVHDLRVGRGQLWLRVESPGEKRVTKLVPVGTGTPGILHPDYGSTVAQGIVFDPQSPVAATSLSLTATYRHQRCGYAKTGDGVPLIVVDAARWAGLANAQVFALSSRGPRASSKARFLGFSSPLGVLSVALDPWENSLLVLGPDGGVGLGSAAMLAGSAGAIHVHRTGTLRIDGPGLIPAGNSEPARAFVLESATTMYGLRPKLRRITGPGQEWQIPGVPAGLYRIVLGGTERSVQITPGETTTVR